MISRPSSRLPGALVPLFMVCCLTSPATAQEEDRVERRDGYGTISASGFRGLPASTPDGRGFDIQFVKFSHLFESTLKVYGGTRDGTPGGRARPSPLHNRLIVTDAKLMKLLASSPPQDSDGKKLVRRQSNIQVFGRTKRTETGIKLVVDRVHRLESYLDYFTRLYEALPAGDARKRLELQRQMRGRVRYFPEDRKALEPLVEKLEKEAREIEYQGLPSLPGGAEEWLKLGYKHRDIELVSKVWGHSEVPEDQRSRAEKILTERLRARFFLGAWYERGELKQKLGFKKTTDGKSWVPQERLWLQAAAEREKKRLAQGVSRVQVTRGVLEQTMNQGNVLRGMPKEMVVAAARKATGPDGSFPIRVDRYQEKAGRQKLVWELWVMADGLRVYFCNGLVTEKEKPTAEPAGEGE